MKIGSLTTENKLVTADKRVYSHVLATVVLKSLKRDHLSSAKSSKPRCTLAGCVSGGVCVVCSLSCDTVYLADTGGWGTSATHRLHLSSW